MIINQTSSDTAVRLKRKIVGQNIYLSLDTNIYQLPDYSDVNNLEGGYFSYAFAGSETLGGPVNFHSLRAVSKMAFREAFQSTAITSADFHSLNYLSDQSFCGTFGYCESLTTVDFHSLSSIYSAEYEAEEGEEYGFYWAFEGCTSLTSVDFSYLTEVGETNVDRAGGLTSAFAGCTALTTVSFPSLRFLGCSAMANCFSGCENLTNLYFPALTDDSFTGTDLTAWEDMVEGTEDCVIHVPDNLDQQLIEGLTGYPNFGGTNTEVIYDLPFSNHLVGANGVTYERNPVGDTENATCFRQAGTYALDATCFYTSTQYPRVGDTIYSDSNCTVVLTTITQRIGE